MSEMRFDGRVAVVTGAGNGLGRSHALLLGARGAKVVVNDLGGTHTGGGHSSAAADAVVAEIRAAGGEAIANYDSVEDGARIVEAALAAWGRIDILVNNAGILRDTSFQKMTQQDWDLIYRVHVLGAFRTTQAAWGPMRDAGYGRILFTASAAGIYGNFGQANYAMAKLGLVGFGKTLAVEGQKKNVFSNIIAPIAGSRMTETILPPDLLAALKPEYVSPLLLWLSHESCQENGGLFEVGGGFVGKLRWERTTGKTFKLGRVLTPEAVRAAWGEITNFEKSEHPADVTAAMGPVLTNATRTSLGSNEFIDVDLALGYELPARESTLTPRDIALYALAVGAAKNPLDAKELRYVYELHGDGFTALPTFAVVPALDYVFTLAKEGQSAPGLNYGFDRILHGEQYLELLRPIPTEGKLSHQGKIKAIYDKGKNAVVVMEILTRTAGGELLARNEVTTVIRGAGGFGGERGPQGDANPLPDRAPDAVVEERVEPNQALMYRLTGDINPLHADPEFARMFGFERPILHGLCTLGIAARHVIASFCDNDSRRFRAMRVRFSESVFPGETLVTEMWKDAHRISFRTKVKERDKVVLSAAHVDLHTQLPLPQVPSPVVADAAVEAPKAPPATTSSADVLLAIRDYVEQNPELVKQVGVVYAFKLTQPDSAWTLDLKTGVGAVTSGAPASAECTLELSDSDFLDMTSGRADPQKLYFSQKLKVTGNPLASQKLTFLKKMDPVAAHKAVAKAKAEGRGFAVAGPTASAPSVDVAAIFGNISERLAARPNLRADLPASLRFIVEGAEYTIVGATAPIITTFTLDTETLVALHGGEPAERLYQRGKLRIDGEMTAARHLSVLRG